MNRRNTENAKPVPDLPEDARKEAEDGGYLPLLEEFVDGFANTYKEGFRYKIGKITKRGNLNLIVERAAVVNIKVRGMEDIPPSGPEKLVVGVALGKGKHRTAYGEVLKCQQPDLSKFEIIRSDVTEGKKANAPEGTNSRTFIYLCSKQDIRRFFLSTKGSAA